jgi:hypothetical protein
MTWKPDPKPEPRSKKKRKRIPYISESKKLDLKLYKQAREEYLNDNPFCERCNVKHSDQIHHQKGRISSLLYNPKYFLAVCDTCRKYIEDNPLEALKMGWSVKRTGL